MDKETKAARKRNNELLETARKLFTDKFTAMGYSISESSDVWMPKLFAHKEGHLTFIMIQFLEPDHPSISVSGNRSSGDIVSPIFYYQLKNPETGLATRFEKLIDTAIEKYDDYAVEEDRQEF